MKVHIPRDFEVKKTHIGRAVFAKRPFERGDIITKFKGPRIHASKMPKRYRGKNDRYVQIERHYYLGPSGQIDDVLNHSCSPNTGLKFMQKEILLVAIKDIEVGDEITWDYSTTLFESPWKMKCRCREKNCRKIIGNFVFLDKKIRQKYLRLGIIPQYLKDYIEKAGDSAYTKKVS